MNINELPGEQSKPSQDYVVNTAHRQFNQLHVKLTDMNGDTVHLNGADWSCLITVYSEGHEHNKKRKLK